MEPEGLVRQVRHETKEENETEMSDGKTLFRNFSTNQIVVLHLLMLLLLLLLLGHSDCCWHRCCCFASRIVAVLLIGGCVFVGDPGAAINYCHGRYCWQRQPSKSQKLQNQRRRSCSDCCGSSAGSTAGSNYYIMFLSSFCLLSFHNSDYEMLRWSAR